MSGEVSWGAPDAPDPLPHLIPSSFCLLSKDPLLYPAPPPGPTADCRHQGREGGVERKLKSGGEETRKVEAQRNDRLGSAVAMWGSEHFRILAPEAARRVAVGLRRTRSAF